MSRALVPSPAARCAIALALVGSVCGAAGAQPPGSPATFDETVAPGANYDKAEFR
jgi:hypothetical protein